VFKSIGNQVCAFDLEWVPDLQSGRRVYDLPATMPDHEVFQCMWKNGGATAEKPRPYLKTIMCRVVAVSAIIRELGANGSVNLRLTTLPKNSDQLMDEGELIATFLGYIGKQKPQLVGFNSQTSDLPILLQRGIAAGISVAEFCSRPDRRWDGTDYFARHGEAHVDLKAIVSGWGIGTPNLHEFAAVMGVPGQVGSTHHTVVDWWVEGNLRAIVEYNQYDALTTYLVWLRTAQFAGFFSPDQYVLEEERVRDLLHRSIQQGADHLVRYLEKWDSFRPQVDPVAINLCPLSEQAA
jgi:3'-5' exonuclease